MTTTTIQLRDRLGKRHDYDCMAHTDAVTDGMLADESISYKIPQGPHPFTRITNWYSDGEADMLENALHQLNGCKVMLVHTGNLVAICRGTSEVKINNPEE